MEQQGGVVGADPPEDEELVNLRNFLVPERGTYYRYSATVIVRRVMPLGLQFRVDAHNDEGRDRIYIFDSLASGRAHTRVLLMEMIRTFGESEHWGHGALYFGYDEGESLDDLIPEVFKLLNSSKGLFKLEVTLEPFCFRHLPILLAENPHLEEVSLFPGEDARSHPIDTEAIAQCFRRNNVLRVCMLGVNNIPSKQSWETMLRPFTANTEEANVTLKELRLAIHCDTPFEEPIANLLRCNTTLETLEVRPLYSAFSYGPVVEALVVNHTLQEFGCVVTDAQMKGLMNVFIPGIFDRSVNTHLKSLILYQPKELNRDELLEADYNCMQEVCNMLELNTTLERVEVTPIIWRIMDGFTRDDKDVILNQRGILESVVREKLRSNTSLQLLILGFWRVHRVRGEWQMSYSAFGPCLAVSVQTAEYDVKVKMRR